MHDPSTSWRQPLWQRAVYIILCAGWTLVKGSEFSLQILDRKNDEIEVLKSLYKNKQNEAEETIRKLEKKGDLYVHGGCSLRGGIVLCPSCGCGLTCFCYVQVSLSSSFASLDLIFPFDFQRLAQLSLLSKFQTVFSKGQRNPVLFNTYRFYESPKKTSLVILKCFDHLFQSFWNLWLKVYLFIYSVHFNQTTMFYLFRTIAARGFKHE